ncbi:hypothetical protein RHMOL_Rhmol01G0375200 [Rhododendron molle]|uniref:Uncharacterized protein n=1 Tax=Rhododendron molle TaxID=49168 RepID=A0ACC0QA17_RHOML|nr:hypothetical protein RHMOL_Rhmol01G0375200 [Rhododendron molle]
MKPTLYNAVMEGNLDVLCQYTDDQLHAEATHNRNTVLHVAAQFGHLQCVEKILEASPSLLTFPNVKGETPLHIAAREGYSDIVRTIIECARKLEQDSESGRGATTKEILRATNVDKDAALHMAVRNCHFEVKKYLEVVILLTKEDVAFEYPANDAKETPLYLAAEQGLEGVDVLSTLLLSTCISSAYGPGGRTALHVATLKDFTGQSTRKLLGWKADLINEADPYGWTPLHYAAYIGNVAAIGELLETDNSAAYIAKVDKKDGNTAFHIAAAHGHVDVMKKLLSYSPDCWEIVNFKGQNVLHMAVDTEREPVINFILSNSWLRQLINQKDKEGNTPLHLLAAASDDIANKLWDDNRAGRHTFNNKNLTPMDVKWPNSKKAGRIIVNNAQDNIAKCKKTHRDEKGTKRRIEEDWTKKNNEEADRMAKMAESHIIVAALIATITFAAAYAIPGGYDGIQDRDQGMAVLSRRAAFKAFAITNTIAVASSVSSLLVYIAGGFLLVQSGNVIALANAYLQGFKLTIISLVAMMLAFISASFAVLAHSVALSIAMCTISCAPLLLLLVPFAYSCVNKFKQQRMHA